MCNPKCEVWAWADILKRLEYIDSVINQIVRDGIVISTGILAVTGTIFIFLGQHTQKNLFLIIAIVCFIGAIISLLLIFNLSRQEHIRQWYFHLLKKYEQEGKGNPDILPQKDWCPDDASTKNWCFVKKIVVCNISSMAAKWGYCTLWITLFFLLMIIFSCLAIFAILLFSGTIQF